MRILIITLFLAVSCSQINNDNSIKLDIAFNKAVKRINKVSVMQPKYYRTNNLLRMVNNGLKEVSTEKEKKELLELKEGLEYKSEPIPEWSSANIISKTQNRIKFQLEKSWSDFSADESGIPLRDIANVIISKQQNGIVLNVHVQTKELGSNRIDSKNTIAEELLMLQLKHLFSEDYRGD